MAVTAVQSATPQQLVQAVIAVLANGYDNVPATGVNEQYIVQNYSNFRPRSAEPYEITVAALQEAPFKYAGAGRKGQNTVFVIEVAIYTRYDADPAGADDDWAKDADYGAFAMRGKVNDLLCGNFLFSAYDPTTKLPSGDCLTIEGLQPAPNPRPDKPQTGDNSGGEDVGGYGVVRLYWTAKTVQPLTLPS